MSEWDDLKKELEAYFAENRGSMSDLARYLDVPRQRVFEWVNNDIIPNYNTGTEIRKWLEEQRK